MFPFPRSKIYHLPPTPFAYVAAVVIGPLDFRVHLDCPDKFIPEWIEENLPEKPAMQGSNLARFAFRISGRRSKQFLTLTIVFYSFFQPYSVFFHGEQPKTMVFPHVFHGKFPHGISRKPRCHGQDHHAPG